MIATVAFARYLSFIHTWAPRSQWAAHRVSIYCGDRLTHCTVLIRCTSHWQHSFGSVFRLSLGDRKLFYPVKCGRTAYIQPNTTNKSYEAANEETEGKKEQKRKAIKSRRNWVEYLCIIRGIKRHNGKCNLTWLKRIDLHQIYGRPA